MTTQKSALKADAETTPCSGETGDSALMLTTERFRTTQRIAKIGSWDWDADRDEHWWSDELYRILEIDPDCPAPIAELMQRVHPDDRAKFRVNRSNYGSEVQPDSYDVRVRMPDGRTRVFHLEGESRFGADGRATGASGTMQDVTEHRQFEDALRRSEARYKESQRLAHLANWEWTLGTNEQWWSDELYRILELEPGAIEPSFERFIEFVHPEDRPAIESGKRALSIETNLQDDSEIRLIVGDKLKVIEMLVEIQCGADGKPEAVVGTIHDVTERRQLENRLRESESRYSKTVRIAAVGIAHVAVDGRFLWANPHLLDLLGYTEDELLDLTVRDVSHPEDLYVAGPERPRLHSGEIEHMKFEKRYLRKDGTTIWARVTSTVMRADDGSILHDVSIVEDISDRKAAEERIRYLAAHDDLTGLPNRTLFAELVSHAINTASRNQRPFAVLFIDLDRFKFVNDSLGHQAGDLLLREMASRLRACMRRSDVVARFGGDEFVVLLEDLADPNDAALIARKILSSVLHPVEILGQECRVTASIGISTFPSDANDAQTLMKQADMAMYEAKETGKNNYQFYSPGTSPMSVERLTLENQLARALERREFTLQYQPKADLHTGEIRGAEALLRWWNSELGTVPPTQFIPVAEDTGLIVPIGKWVMQMACAQNVDWQRHGCPRIVMAVNLSPRQFQDPALLDDISQVLHETGMAADLLELEITESMIMHNVDRAAEKIAAIKNLGVRLAIDDFGTGYSSLSQLKRFPIDTLKVDRSFVRDIPHNAEDKAITEAIISLGKTLGVNVVAEGVETAEQCAFLRERACDEMQGYYFSKPCHPQAFAELLRSTDHSGLMRMVGG